MSQEANAWLAEWIELFDDWALDVEEALGAGDKRRCRSAWKAPDEPLGGPPSAETTTFHASCRSADPIRVASARATKGRGNPR